MQNDNGFSQADFAQADMAASFDLFGYPLSAPSSAGFDTTQSFWEGDTMGLNGMELDFTVSGDLFQVTSPTSTNTHRQMGSFDWTRNPPDMFQRPSGTEAPTTQESSTAFVTNTTSASKSNAVAPVPTLAPEMSPTLTVPMSARHAAADSAPTSKPARPLAPKPPTIPSPEAAIFGGPILSSRTSISDDPFSKSDKNKDIANRSSSYMVPLSANSMAQSSLNGTLRRSASTKEISTNKQGPRAPLGSPVKPGSLQRSASDNKGKRPLHRTSLPALAPAIKPCAPMSQPVSTSSTVLVPSFNGSQQKIYPGLSNGRISPSKHHHRRLPSLSAIPESSPRPNRTDVKFVIDARGRAHVEPVIVNGEYIESFNRSPIRQPEVVSSDDDSSDDDKPIIIPSRTTSFALPDPIEVKPSASFHASQRSISERSAISFSSYRSERCNSTNDGDSDTDTLVYRSRSKVSGDAASELRRVVETRNRRPTSHSRQLSRPVSASFGASLMSPASVTESRIPTPIDRQNSVRCSCGNITELPDEYMIQCESCEMWLHGRCLNINAKNHPRVYICAFCANTHTGKLRAATPKNGPRSTISSPLANKNFKSFR